MHQMHDRTLAPDDSTAAMLPRRSMPYGRANSYTTTESGPIEASLPARAELMERTVYEGSSSDQAERPRYYCDACNNRSFSSKTNLQRHQREQHEHEQGRPAPVWPCPGCGENFTRSTALRNHRERGTCERKQEISRRRSDFHR